MGIIARILGQNPERIAVEAGGLPVTFARLAADIDAAAARFRAAGIDEGTTLGLRAGSADNGHDYANWVAHLAAMKLGAAHVSLIDRGTIKAAMQAARLDMVVGPFEALVDVPASVRRLEFHCGPSVPLPAADGEPVADREASARRLNLTSGTTGRPRLVAWDSALIERRVMQVADGAPVDRETRLFPLLHLRTTAGFRYPLATWASGGLVVLPRARKGIERDREGMPGANLLTCSPPQLKERLAAHAGAWPGREDRTILLLGGRLPTAVRDAALARACSRLLISYGSTETGGIAIGDHRLIDRHPGAVGLLRPGVEVEVVGADDVPLPAGEAGLVRARSALMVTRHEEAGGGGEPASGHFRDGWFYPGDIGRLFEDGMLAIEGRVGDTLNLGGWKVSASDLETKAGALPGVRDVCVLSVPLPEGDLLTFALVCDDGFDIESFRRRARAMLSRSRPFSVVRLPAIPRNAMGKVPRGLVAGRLAAMHAATRRKATNA